MNENMKNFMKEVEKTSKGEVKVSTLTHEDIQRIPTGLLNLDIDLAGGIPKGKVTEFFSKEGAGKTTLALHVAAEVAKLGGTTMFCDAEHAFNPNRAIALGVPAGQFAYYQPPHGEKGFEVMFQAIEKQGLSDGDLGVIDSIAEMRPQKMVEGDDLTKEERMGIHPKLITRAFGKIVKRLTPAGVTIIAVNQLRDDLKSPYGGTTTPGGRALRHLSRLRAEVRSLKRHKRPHPTIAGEQQTYAQEVLVTVKKSNFSQPYTETRLFLDLTVGVFSREYSLLLGAIQLGVITRTGSYINYEKKKFHGEAKFYEALQKEPVLFTEIDVKCREILEGMEKPQVTDEPDDTAGGSDEE